ncbi:two-component system cell cycle response regulator DivK [Methanohalophilus euhalobius]|uniref:Two-component system cell cycle response regulator DivK n=1 Tax=Methanohalophilus euhalobius TaxID=51203 RepID=A0A285G971_9EURY|nr:MULTISPECIES: response regulator [Methanohalophilus]ODV50404.1 MAG: two-component system, cell cycle response regulator DivK [Methanohalophilus sp. 2-GBenrich]TCL11804.1 two-component system cell cycle response regulator DivK [Methanohalophilus euhalobius]SNY20005.1 two-component system, cell cycle response regulator DivK [Methanohalophilus euhalobius]
MATILVVEDNPMNMELTVDLLESYGYEVMQAEDGSQALEVAEKNTFDLILLDMQLPKMDGLEVLEKFKEIENAKDTPVVALTAHAMRGDDKKFIDAGCAGYISKPIDIHDFQQTVSSYVEN